jgi:hypothetical protein
MKQVRETAVGGGFIFMGKGRTKFRVFCKFLNWHGNNGRTRTLYLNFPSVSRYAILAEVWNVEIAKVWNQEIAEVWNQEMTRLSIFSADGICSLLRNSVKPCHPRNVGLPRFMKQVREAAVGGGFIFMGKGRSEES